MGSCPSALTASRKWLLKSVCAVATSMRICTSASESSPDTWFASIQLRILLRGVHWFSP